MNGSMQNDIDIVHSQEDPTLHIQWQQLLWGRWRVLPQEWQRQLEQRLSQGNIPLWNELMWFQVQWWDHDKEVQRDKWYVINLNTMKLHQEHAQGYWRRLRRLHWWADEPPPYGYVPLRGEWKWTWGIPGEHHINYG